MSKPISRLGLLVAASGLSLAVAGIIPALAAEHIFDGVYFGKRMLTKGSAGSDCPAEDNVSVVIHGNTLTFTNSALKHFVQAFYPKQDGSFGNTYTDEGGMAVHYQGRIVADVLDANVSNGDCDYHWHLKKK